VSLPAICYRKRNSPTHWFNYSVIGGILQRCVRNNILPAETNIDVIIVLHSAFSGLIKNWLLEPQRFDLYQQAPALVDNIMAVVCAARLSQEPVLRVVNQ
jgi:TetR/AcrR family transcriptional repressor of acrEF/envCD operon